MGNNSSSVTVNPSLSEKEIAAPLQELYEKDRAKFERVVAQIRINGRSTKPQFPPIDLNTVKPVPPEEVEAFKTKNISKIYLDYGSPEAKERMEDTRGLQYKRWNWACDNLSTYVNMLRVSGYSDEAIRNMLDGTPLCFPSPEAYREIRVALKQLAKDIEAEQGWTNCTFVITGSSVPGFSQNPVKGFAFTPSKITSATKSDVDICIIADGVDAAVKGRREGGDEEPKWTFPTTCSASTAGTRYGCRELSPLSKCVDEFYQIWSKKLPGGLQFTFAEDDIDIPPWEARIDVINV